jgi:hypothetical protein
MPKRKWTHYFKGKPNYANDFRRALPSASERDKGAIKKVARAHDELRTHDTSHLLVSEEFRTTRGGTRVVEFYHPVRLVQYVLDHSASFAEHYGRIAINREEAPWRLLFGFDEQTPGSKINADNKRKNMCCVMNFLEVGSDCLEVDQSWFIPVVLRAGFCREVVGGWSAILRRILNRALLGPESFSNHGLLVRFIHEGRPWVKQIKAVLDTALTDGEGHQVALQWNGASSMKPTFDFANVFKKDAGMAGSTQGYMDITCSDWRALRRWQRLQWLELIDGVLAERERFARGEIRSYQLQAHIKSSGFCVTEQGLLADRGLREVVDFLAVFKYDFMHTAFQDGYMSNAMYLISSSVFRVKYRKPSDPTSLIAFLGELQFPMSRGDDRRLKALFSDKLITKQRKRRSIVANASCQLSLYRLIEFWAIEEASDCPALLEHCAVYSAACRVTDVFLGVKHRRTETARAKEALIGLVGEWQSLHKAKYGTRHFKPKFFWLWPITFDIASAEWLFDMFYVERQHKRVKRQAELVKNTTQFEGSVLQRVLDEQVTNLQKFDLLAMNYRLAESSTQSLCGGIPARLADSLVWKGVSIHVDDIVAFERLQLVGVVIACYQLLDKQLGVQVEIMRRHSRVRFEHTAEQKFWHAHEVRHMIAWRPRGDRMYDVVSGWM